MHIAEPVAEVDAEQPTGQTDAASGRAREADRAHRLDVTSARSDAEIGPREHQAMAMMPADALGHLPVEHRRLDPRERTIGGSSGRAVDQHQRRDSVGYHVRTFDSETQRHRATHRVAHHDGAAEIEHTEHRGQVIDEPIEAERHRHRRRATESSLVDGNHAPTTRHQPRRQRGEDPEIAPETVQQHHRPAGAALLGVQHATVGRGDGPDALGRKGEAVAEVGIRRGIEPGEDTMLVDHAAGDNRTDESSGHQVSPSTYVAAVHSSMIRNANLETLARISRGGRHLGVPIRASGVS